MTMINSVAECRCVPLLLLLIFIAGCPPTQDNSPGRPQSDLLSERYADLASGRFAVIADFEEFGQAELFHAGSTEQSAPVVVNNGVAATGGHALQFKLRSPDDRLVIDNRSATTWLLKRHWQTYNLLLVNVDSPREGILLDLAIVSGDDDFATEAHSTAPLEKGWNLLRLDLNEAADFIALDDVRAVEISAPALDEPVTLIIDDILLANNRRVVAGDPNARDNSLYVVQEGRRMSVGAAGRFEIGFANGQIVCWYALAVDPARVNDLVGGGNVLGPMPIVLPDDVEHMEDIGPPVGFDALGDLIVARQQLVEVGPVRAVVEVAWRYGEHAGDVNGGSPLQRWTYTIYPSGRLFVEIECTTSSDDFEADDVGLVFSRKLGPSMASVVHEAAGLDRDPAMRHVSYGCLADGGRRGRDLLCVMHDSRHAPRMRSVRDTLNHRFSLVAYDGMIEHPAHTWHCLLDLDGASDCEPTQCETNALSYCDPAGAQFTVGGLDTTTEGDADQDGFNERYGTLMLAPSGARVQLRLDGRERPIVNPTFCVVGSAERDAWVYVDYVIDDQVGRDADGNLIFELNRVIDGELNVEVYLRDRAS